jgi:hypothetical protein
VNFWAQLRSAEWVWLTVVLCVGVLRLNFFLGTVHDQIASVESNVAQGCA